MSTEIGEMTEQRFPANWYHDPEGGSGLRYWDGTQWTEHRAPGPSAAPTAREPLTAEPASTPASRRNRAFLTIVAVALVIVLVIVVIGVATRSSSKSSPPRSNGSSTEVSAGKSGLDRDAQVIQATVAHVLVALARAENHPTTANVNELARVAQQARDSLNNETSTLKREIDTSNADEASLSDAVDGVGKSMSALVTYAGDPRTRALGSFRRQYRPAVAEWNRAVRAIYAHTGKALPTLPAA